MVNNKFSEAEHQKMWDIDNIVKHMERNCMVKGNSQSQQNVKKNFFSSNKMFCFYVFS